MATHTLSPTPSLRTHLGRRAFAGAAAVAGAFASVGLTAGAAAAMADLAPDPNAELIAIGREAAPLIAEYERLTAEWFALPMGHPELNRVATLSEPLGDRLTELFDQAMLLQSRTFAGLQAKAMLVQHEIRYQNRQDGEVVFNDTGSEGAWSLVEDLLRLGRA